MVINNKTHIFPASGYRRESDGALRDLGVWGFGWSSIPSDGRAWALEFFSGLAHVGALARNGGFPVRCVQASAAVFAFIKRNIEDTLFFFPATAWRRAFDGKLFGSGSEGDGWSSVPADDDNAAYFRSRSDIVHVDRTGRGAGLSVRCVQASAAVWAVHKKYIKQIRYRRESGKASLYRRGQADSVTRLGRKLSISETHFVYAAPSYLFTLIKILVSNCLYSYKYFSGYFFFFPAAGYRHYSDGSLRSSGTEGFGWTSLPDGSNAFFLRFLSGIAHVREAPRTYGFPVRCVQASAVLFAPDENMNENLNAGEVVTYLLKSECR